MSHIHWAVLNVCKKKLKHVIGLTKPTLLVLNPDYLCLQIARPTRRVSDDVFHDYSWDISQS
jgi:hypothetical protein